LKTLQFLTQCFVVVKRMKQLTGATKPHSPAHEELLKRALRIQAATGSDKTDRAKRLKCQTGPKRPK
jgi:hypothetical protein